MKIYRFWSRAETTVPGIEWKLACFGGSNQSPNHAQEQARSRLADLVRRATGQRLQKRYAYTDRPLREEVKEELRQGEELEAVITRNAYGSLVLNTARVMFIDLDFPPESLWRRFKRALGLAADDREEVLQQRLTEQVQAEPGLGLRLYRTANGFRGLVTSALHDPAAPATRGLLERFGSDPLYIRLCQAQECFRARLTPKHWRCNLPRPPGRAAWLDPRVEPALREWEREYELRTAGHATCRFVIALGARQVLPAVERVVRLHDAVACRPGELA